MAEFVLNAVSLIKHVSNADRGASATSSMNPSSRSVCAKSPGVIHLGASNLRGFGYHTALA
ncbi:predicted protein [Coccidioides posadasii str. Silveira]|uniref:Predicted protein n=1 Tax=Coccidioides posadasii (strain RMSCC 757 / Silveira) TaxID=443226 RepID=E9D6P6_COCPS|nr:predicted protein [Coccidioides posadasii str. Silveira]